MRFTYALLGGILLGVLPLIKLWMIYPLSLDSKIIHAQLIAVVVRGERTEIADTGVHVVGVDCTELELTLKIPLGDGSRFFVTPHVQMLCGAGRRSESERIKRLLYSNVSGFWSESDKKFILTQFDKNISSNLIWLTIILFFVGCLVGSRVRRES